MKRGCEYDICDECDQNGCSEYHCNLWCALNEEDYDFEYELSKAAEERQEYLR